jgi:cell division transport system ATP-binding protein
MIELIHVSRTYQNDWQALKDVNFTIEKGEFVFMTGPSGSGKSTIIRLMMMEEFPDEGVVKIAGFGSDCIKKKEIPQLRRKLGVIFQDFKLLPERTVYENVAFALEVTGVSSGIIHKKSMAALNQVGLSHKRHSLPYQMSGGEQQKVAIARALVNEPFILLADEPTGNVDPVGAREIIGLLKDINAKGTAVLMATHEQEMVRSMPYRVLMLNNGQIEKDLPGKITKRRMEMEELPL